MGLYKKLYDKYVWGMKYRPEKVEDLFLPPRIMNYMTDIVSTGNLPNMMLSGPAGTGKTSCAVVLAESLGREVLYINTSKNTGIDILRDKIESFVSACAWNGEKKIVIMDEFDRASANLQDGFKVDIEEFSKTCNFIILTNHKNKIIPPLQSRMQHTEFAFTKGEKKKLKVQFFKRCIEILKVEKAEYNDKVVAHIVENLFPDMRKILNELQKFAQQRVLNDLEAVKNIIGDLETFYVMLREKQFMKVRKYVSDIASDPQSFYSQIYDSCLKYVEGESLPEFVILLSKYAFESAFVIDPSINIMAFSTEVMSSCQFKKNF